MPRLLKRPVGAQPQSVSQNAAARSFDLLEKLEDRRMFSVISVNKFGAVPNDGLDDSAAVISAIRASVSGDTISFGAGSYNLNSRIDLPAGLTIDGGKVATLVSARGDMMFHFNSKVLTIQNFKLIDGGLVFIEGLGSRNPSDVTINWCNFTNIDQGADIGATHGAIGSPGSRLNNFVLENCDFEGDGSGMCFNAYTGDNWYIINNRFVNVLGSIKSNNVENTANNININGNYFSENRRHAVELQGSVNTFRFLDNYYEKPRISSDFTSNDSTFAFSLIYTATSTDQLIARNYIVVPPAAQEPDGLGPRVAFEAGESAEVTDNYVIGCGTFATTYGPSSVVHDNKVKDQLYGVGYPYGPQTPVASRFYNNGWDTTLTWDINRGIPGPGGKYTPGGSGGSSGYNPPPITGSGDFTLLTGTVLNTSQVRLDWTDESSEIGYRVDRSLDNKSWTLGVFNSYAPNVLTYTDKSLPAGTVLYYRVVPYTASGDLLASNTVPLQTKGKKTTSGSGSGTGAKLGALAFSPIVTPTANLATLRTKTSNLDDDLFGKTTITL